MYEIWTFDRPASQPLPSETDQAIVKHATFKYMSGCGCGSSTGCMRSKHIAHARNIITQQYCICSTKILESVQWAAANQTKPVKQKALHMHKHLLFFLLSFYYFLPLQSYFYFIFFIFLCVAVAYQTSISRGAKPQHSIAVVQSNGSLPGKRKRTRVCEEKGKKLWYKNKKHNFISRVY